MAETLFEELKRYVEWSPEDERVLQALRPLAAPEFERISVVFYDRILTHEGARTALEGGESQVGRLKVTLQAWMDKLLSGPWDEDYYQLRCRIGRVHVRIALPQHYMFGAMNVLRENLQALVEKHYLNDPAMLSATRRAVGKALDLELAIMLHTYREDLLAEKAKSERLSTFGQLVGSIGHELRNPLGVIETSLFILRGRVSEDERAKKHVERIGEQIVVANQIITDLLDLIRDKPLTRERVEPQALVAAAVSLVGRPPGVKLVVEGVEELPAIQADGSQLRQVFVNLVENAVHAASPEGEVRITGRSGPGGIDLAVEDTGPGVDPSVRRRLFEPLITTKVKGIGLGLALVKRIVDRHGGSITYAPQGRGARFVVRLPTTESR